MKTTRSFVTRIDEYRKLLSDLANSTPGEKAKELAGRISAMFEEDVKFANASRRVDALKEEEQDALDCIREYWAKERIDLRRGHAEWVQRSHGLLDYISYYDHHHRKK